jgi:hypothetical protein
LLSFNFPCFLFGLENSRGNLIQQLQHHVLLNYFLHARRSPAPGQGVHARRGPNLGDLWLLQMEQRTDSNKPFRFIIHSSQFLWYKMFLKIFLYITYKIFLTTKHFYHSVISPLNLIVHTRNLFVTVFSKNILLYT